MRVEDSFVLAESKRKRAAQEEIHQNDCVLNPYGGGPLTKKSAAHQTVSTAAA